MNKEKKSYVMGLVILWQSSSFEFYVCDLCCWLQHNCNSA